MIKIKITGVSEEVSRAAEMLKDSFEILEVSNEYPNRNSQYVRKYVEAEIKDYSAIVIDTETTGINPEQDELL